MSFKIFISYSLSPEEFAALFAVSEEASKKGISCYIPDRRWSPTVDLPDQIKGNLKDADAVLVIASEHGVHYDWLNQELEAAVALSKKNIVFLADRNVAIHDSWRPYCIPIDRANSAHTISLITRKLEDMKLAKEQETALTWLAVGAVLFLLFLVLAAADR